MSKTLIVAYGNLLRSDDGLAWKAAEELSRLTFSHNVELEIVTLHQPTPELAVAVSEAAMVLFLDAARAGIPGELALQKLQPKAQSSGFTHEFSPSTILSLARELYDKTPEAFLLSMCGECFDHGDTLSATIRHSLPAFVQRARDLIASSAGDLTISP